jgi:hypothetical protein
MYVYVCDVRRAAIALAVVRGKQGSQVLGRCERIGDRRAVLGRAARSLSALSPGVRTST